jgi:MATE family multidrug resistance protein
MYNLASNKFSEDRKMALSRNMRIKQEAAALWQLAWPVLIGQIATVGMAVADVSMTGHASAQDLAAVALGASVWVIVLVTVSGIMMAINAMAAHEVGAGQIGRIPHLVRQSMWKALAVGLIGCALANLAVQVYDVLDLEPVVRDKARHFVRLISIGMPAFAMFRTLYGYSASLSQTKPLMVISLLGLGWNVLVNWLFIYGQFGLPRMGALGCALATASGMWLMLLALLWWLRRAPAYRESYPFHQWEGPQWPTIRPMLKMGLPIGVTYLAEVSAFSVVGLLVAKFGVVTLSAHQITLNFSSLVFMVPLSFGIGLITRVGQMLGEGDPLRARFAAWVGIAMALSFGALSALGIVLFRWQIAAAYSSDPQVQAMTAHLLLFAALFQLSDATQVATSCAIRGYKVTKRPMLIHLLAFWGFSVPLGCVLGLAPAWLGWPWPAMGVTGFWIGLVLGLTVAAVLLVHFLRQLANMRARESAV